MKAIFLATVTHTLRGCSVKPFVQGVFTLSSATAVCPPHTTTTATAAPSAEELLLEFVEGALGASPYRNRFAHVRLEVVSASHVVINGHVVTYHMKQMVQETIKRVVGVEGLTNNLLVDA